MDFDVLLATNFLPPATHRDGVVMVVHDLAHEHLPGSAPHLNARWRRSFDRWLAKAAGIIVPSESTRADLLAGHDVDPERVPVTPLGVDVAAFAPAEPAAVDAVRRRFGIDGRYALFVGGIEPRKNLENLVAAFAIARAGNPLGPGGRAGAVGSGRGVQASDEVISTLAPAARARIVRTGHVNDQEKVALLTGATLLAYPSLYEGFGFPVLEGFAAGVPVLTSDVSSLPEVAGDAAVLVDPARSDCDRRRTRSAVRRRGPPRHAVGGGSHARLQVHVGEDRPPHRGGGARRPRTVARVDSARPGPVRGSSMTDPTHVLVTGGAGFIGSHLVDALLATDTRVTVLDKLTYAGTRKNLSDHEGDDRLRFVQGDVADPAAVGPLVADVQRVVHAAAETHVDRSIAGPAAFVMTNVVGTQVVLDACRDHGRPLLLISTDEVYGENEPDGRFDEGAPLRPRSPYAASKAGAELIARAHGITFGTPVTIVRGTNAFGPRQNPEKVIPVFTLAALQGRPLPVYDRGLQSREWLYVTDWVAACLTALRHGEPGDVFNIGDGTELTNVELARRICALTGAVESSVTFVADRPGHDFRYGVTTGRLHELGWRPQVTFDDGLASTVAWYRDHAAWVRSMHAGASAS